MSTQFANTFGSRAGLGPAKDPLVHCDNNTRMISENDSAAMEGESYVILPIQHEVVHHRNGIVRGLPRTAQNTIKANDTLKHFLHLPRHLSSKPQHAADSFKANT